jgi:O-Antigen ligase
MRFPLAAIAATVLLASPFALAAFHGGYGEEARLVAGVSIWLLVAVAAVAAPVPLPRRAPARLAVGGLAALLALTLVSLAWAPLAAPAYGDAQRVALYLGALVAGLAFLRAHGIARWVVPALAAGAIATVVVGLSERLAPWLVTLERSAAAGGRLSAPLGYWNAMGALAAIGLVLSVGVAGDVTRQARVRAAAAAAAPLLGAGIALSYSRGAIVAAGAGVAVVLLSRPSRAQLRAAVIAVAAAVIAGIAAVLLPDVGDLTAVEGRRSLQGAVLAVVLLVAAAAAWAAQRTGASQDDGRSARSTPRPWLIGAAMVVVTLAAVALMATAESGRRTGDPAFGAQAERLRSVESNRYAYWRVAVDTWAEHPIAGAGSGAFAVEWLRRRTVSGAARDAHSLPLETAAELGIAGLLALGLLVAGVVAGFIRLHRFAPGAEAAAAGGLAAWSVHALLDWAWEMPSVTLVALLLAAAGLAAAEERQRAANARGRQSAEPTATTAAIA